MITIIFGCKNKPFKEYEKLPEGIRYTTKIFWKQRKHITKRTLLNDKDKKLIKECASTHSQNHEGEIKIESIPPAANVIIDGIKIGKTPISLHGVKAGRHFIKIMLDTFKNSTQIITVKANKTIRLKIRLQKYLSNLYINSSIKKAKVYLDNRFVGLTPVKLKNITMGVHRIWLQKIVKGKKYYGYGEIWLNQENKAWNIKMKPYVIPVNFVKIPAGWFKMGINPQQKGEGPTRRVFTNAFYISKYETTNKEFKSIIKNHKPSPYSSDDTQPVTNVTWYEAYLYAKRMGLRLPTEAEWEKAARGGKNLQIAIKGGRKAYRPKRTVWMNFEGLEQGSTNVKNMSPNTYGLYNMSGNANEWVFDWYDEKYFIWGTRKNPAGPEFGTLKVMRGSSWIDKGYLANLATRYKYYPDERKHFGGFRCALNAWIE